MIEDDRPSDSFEPFNFVPDPGHDLEMALAQALWQECQILPDEHEAKPDLLATVEIAGDPPVQEEIAPTSQSDHQSCLAETMGEAQERSLTTIVLPSIGASCLPLEIYPIPRLAQLKSSRNRLQRETPRTKEMHSLAWAGHGPPPAPQDCYARTNAIDRIAQVISRHEGRPDSINWNDNGAGISAGMFQANQKRGELPSLLHRMEKADAHLFAHLLGAGLAKLARNQPEKIRQIAFANHTGTAPNKLGLQLHEALKQPLFQQVQLVMLQEKIVHAAKVASVYGIRSERGIALVADLINQLGEGSGTCGARYYLGFALSRKTEAGKIAQIINHDLKGFGRSARDRDILLNPSLGSSGLLYPDQTAQAQSITVHAKANHHTGSYI
ncbi:MAG: hypothetical protein C5B53_07325 [Candidatus Melainabacteria bacterium]|nr:MAG: hypothetical protein C5B53_07325 [Candidatus Melainabacteria bacterium]